MIIRYYYFFWNNAVFYETTFFFFKYFSPDIIIFRSKYYSILQFLPIFGKNFLYVSVFFEIF